MGLYYVRSRRRRGAGETINCCEDVAGAVGYLEVCGRLRKRPPHPYGISLAVTQGHYDTLDPTREGAGTKVEVVYDN